MRIHSKIVIDMTSGKILEDECYEYSGPLALCKKGGGGVPPAPDLIGAAREQGTQNLRAAIASSILSNPNIVTPFGSQTVSWSPGIGDMSFGGGSAGGSAGSTGGKAGMSSGGDSGKAGMFNNAVPQPSFSEDGEFTVPVPTVTQTLSPEQQAIFEQQQQLQQGVGATAQQGLEGLQGIIGSQIDLSSLPSGVNFDLPNASGVAGGLTSGLSDPGSIAGLLRSGLADPSQVAGQARAGLRDPNAIAQGMTQGLEDPSQIAQGITSGLPQAPIRPGQTAQQAIMSRLQPQLERQQEQLRTRLVNQGAMPGSEAFSNAIQDQSQQQNDLLTQAALQGIGLDQAARQQAFQEAVGARDLGLRQRGQGFGEQLQAGQFGQQARQQQFQEQLGALGFGQDVRGQGLQEALASRGFGLGERQQGLQEQLQAGGFGEDVRSRRLAEALQSGTFGQQLRQQALQEQAFQRSQPLNEFLSLMGQQQLQMPQFPGFQGSGFAPPDIFGATQGQSQYATDIYNAQQARAANSTNALYGLGGSALMAFMLSDPRFKRDIERVGSLESGIPMYVYRYFDDKVKRLGVMADEVEKVIPGAVVEVHGIKAVNYAMIH